MELWPNKTIFAAGQTQLARHLLSANDQLAFKPTKEDAHSVTPFHRYLLQLYCSFSYQPPPITASHRPFSYQAPPITASHRPFSYQAPPITASHSPYCFHYCVTLNQPITDKPSYISHRLLPFFTSDMISSPD
ncbi:hypothetical protein DdX_19048 [Ditylenchus destructor]|uniref:Uncharacterized protein n=1 Tax=Ditylenchus destructor TaxID=166010 RepID=A0AAD4ML52_9BILA|nr:hypothetical protein DdX_19048 [Ditylenchus destructor]